MKSPLTTIVSARIGTQIALLMTSALALAHVVMAAGFVLLDPILPAPTLPFHAVERLVFLARIFSTDTDHDRRATVLQMAQRADPSIAVLDKAPPAKLVEPDARILRDVQSELGENVELFVTRPTSGASEQRPLSLVARLSDGTLLAVALPTPSGRMFFISPAAIGTLAFLASAVIVLSLWAARQLTAPLTKFVDAAERFTADTECAPIPEDGPLEVRRAAKALNDMQARVTKLIADRTRMLAAVSHDLRTPITRLRLRAEEIDNPELRSLVLRDLGTMQNLVQSALSFLRGQHVSGVAIKTDLPPLVQTVCDGFSDTGRNVQYSGPAHLYVRCEPDQLMRALENLIDNGLKFGSAVTVRVGRQEKDAVIEIQDDGPGVSETEKAEVIKPFYRGDAARNLEKGDSFGLGLSIAHAIIERNGGRFRLIDGRPTGLLVRITLPGRHE